MLYFVFSYNKAIFAIVDEITDITIEDKENLLALLYDLLNPESIQVSQSELIKIKTIADKEKYLAAVHIAQTKDSAAAKSQQTSIVLMTSRRASPMSSTTTSAQSSPRERRRDRSSSESDMKIAVHKRNAANEISRSYTSNLEQESRWDRN